MTMSGYLTIKQNGNEALTLEGDDNVLPLITTRMAALERHGGIL